jgi:DNA-binding FadR family transcriptional regulator
LALTDQAIIKIKNMIAEGVLVPGSRLPPEAELAKQLGLSRNSLREGVKALELMRVLDVRQGDGTYVTSLRSDVLLEAVTFGLELHQDDSVLQFHEVRELLEPEVAAKAAALITDEELARLEDCLEEMKATNNPEELIQKDIAFHRLIADAARNPALTGILDAMATKTARARRWRAVVGAQGIADAIEEHRELLQALRDRQPAVARAQMLVHIHGVGRWLETAFGLPVTEAPAEDGQATELATEVVAGLD